jgi:hypothetical protein
MDGRMMQLAQMCDDAFVLLLRGAAEELQRDVPGFWRGPAKVVRECWISSGGPYPIYFRVEIARCGEGQRNADEQPHISV